MIKNGVACESRLHLPLRLLRKLTSTPPPARATANSIYISQPAFCANLRLHLRLPAAPCRLYKFHYQNLPIFGIPFSKVCIKSVQMIKNGVACESRLHLPLRLLRKLAPTSVLARRAANPGFISYSASCANLRPHRYLCTRLRAGI